MEKLNEAFSRNACRIRDGRTDGRTDGTKSIGPPNLKALEQHGKQLDKYSEKQSLAHSKQKEISEELANRRIAEIQELTSQTDLNKLFYH